MWKLQTSKNTPLDIFLLLNEIDYFSTNNYRIYIFTHPEHRLKIIEFYIISRLHEEYPELEPKLQQERKYSLSLNLTIQKKIDNNIDRIKQHIKFNFLNKREAHWGAAEEKFIQNALRATSEQFSQTEIDSQRFLDIKGHFEYCNDIKYVVVNSDGGFTLLNKDGTTILTEFYQSRENIIAILIHFRPKKVFVYDHQGLMESELVLALRKKIGNGVEMINEKFPYSYNL